MKISESQRSQGYPWQNRIDLCLQPNCTSALVSLVEDVASVVAGGNLNNTPRSWLHIGPSNIEGHILK